MIDKSSPQAYINVYEPHGRRFAPPCGSIRLKNIRIGFKPQPWRPKSRSPQGVGSKERDV